MLLSAARQTTEERITEPTNKAMPGRREGHARRPIRRLRWWIGGILLASTIVNYIDRQTLSLLAPYLKLEYHWTNTDYANIVIGFRVAYSLGQTAFGRFMDRIGATLGVALGMIFKRLPVADAIRPLHSQRSDTERLPGRNDSKYACTWFWTPTTFVVPREMLQLL